MSFAPIAIVGRACVLPGALSPEELWAVVRDGRELITRVPEQRWRASSEDILCPPDTPGSDRSWSDRGGYVQNFEKIWNPEGFDIAANKLSGLDPLFHWTLHCSREALRDVGDERTGAIERRRVSAVFGNLGFPSGIFCSISRIPFQCV